MDFNKMMNDSLAKLKAEGYVEKVVQERIQKTVDDVVKDVFDSWSHFGKELKSQLKDQVKINLENLDIPSYNQVIMNTITGELENIVHDQGVRAIKEHMAEILGTSKKDVKLSEIIEAIMKEYEKLEELEYEESHEMTVHIDRKYKHSTYIYIDPSDEDVAWYSCKYKITLNEDGVIKSIEVEGTEFDNKALLSGMYGVDKQLFKMWVRQAKVVIDDYRTSFSNPEYE